MKILKKGSLFLLLLFWIIQRFSKTEMGLLFGPLKYYGLALLYPAVVLGLTGLIVFICGDYAIEAPDWGKILLNTAVGCTIGVIALMLTEEGFFRGLIWASFIQSGLSNKHTLWLTSAFFTIWHISAVTSGSEYGLPIEQVPVYLINATLLGLIWGLLRMMSGSIIVASLSHTVWNTFAYELFGFGEKVGSLGVENTKWFGPEVGYLGILLNGLFFIWLWKKANKDELI